MNKPDRENQAVKQQCLRANGCIIRVHYNLMGVRFRRHLQVVRRSTGEASPYFDKYSECIRWAIGDRLLVQGHSNMLHTRADDYVRAMKDYGEYSPWFKELDDLVRWLEIVPYDSRQDDKLTVAGCYPMVKEILMSPSSDPRHAQDHVETVRIHQKCVSCSRALRGKYTQVVPAGQTITGVRCPHCETVNEVKSQVRRETL